MRSSILSIAVYMVLVCTCLKAVEFTDPGLILPDNYSGIGGSGDKFSSGLDVQGVEMVVTAPGQMYDGALTVFARTNDTWNQVEYIVPQPNVTFGGAIDIDGENMVVGGTLNYNNNAAHVFGKEAGKWVYKESFTPPNFVDDEGFGLSVKIYGNHMFIGSPWHDDAGRYQAGAVWYYKKVNGAWMPQALYRGDSQVEEQFGHSIDVSGGKIAIGAPENESTGGVYIYRINNQGLVFEEVIYPDDPSDFRFGQCIKFRNNQMLVGSARRYYVYEDSGSGWSLNSQLNTVNIPFSNSNDNAACEISGNIAIVGSKYENNSNGGWAGAAYVFRKVNGIWQESFKIMDPDGENSSLFGHDVKIINGMTLIASTTKNNTGMIQSFTNGNWSALQNISPELGLPQMHFGVIVEASDDEVIITTEAANYQKARAFVFEKIGADWMQKQELASDNDNETWPLAVGITNQHLMIGVNLHNGTDFVRTYKKDNGQWVQRQIIENTSWEFGRALAVEGDMAVVSARREGAGIVYAYEYVNGSWQETQTIIGSDSVNADYFGYELFLKNDLMVVGAPFHNNRKGAAYVFERNQAGDWQEVQKLVHSDASSPGPWHKFGSYITGDDENIFITSPGRSHSYRFTKVGGSWQEQQFIESDGAISFKNGQLLVLKAGQSSPSQPGGAAKVYDLINNQLVYRSTFKPKPASRSNNYSEYSLYSVGMSENRAVVGSFAGNYLGYFSGSAFEVDLEIVDIIFKSSFY